MTKDTAKLIWDAKYKRKMKWDEIEGRIGMTRQSVWKWWDKYGIKPKFSRISHKNNMEVSDESIIKNLTIDN